MSSGTRLRALFLDRNLSVRPLPLGSVLPRVARITARAQRISGSIVTAEVRWLHRASNTE